MIRSAAGIEVTFSQDDMSVDSYYYVDDSVSVKEEASATYGSGITDSREVSGPGHIYADQQYTTSSYWGFVQAHGSAGGSLTGSAIMTPTSLSARQSASLSGRDVYAYMEGWQGYMGSAAATAQDAFVQGTPSKPGYLNTLQTLSLGSSIYSTQNTYAKGFNSYALGAAGLLQKYEGWGQFQGQGALTGVASLGDPDGSIVGNLDTEIVRTVEYIVDPVAYGSIKAQSKNIAFGGALAGNLDTDMTHGKIDVQGAAALTGAYNGQLEAYVGSRTEQSHSAWIDGQSSGGIALQAAAAGDLKANLAKQKASADGALIIAGAGAGQVGGAMSASNKKNSANVYGSSVNAGGALAGVGAVAGDLDVSWKNNLRLGTEGSAVGAGAVAGAVNAEKMSALVNNRGTGAKIDGLSAYGFAVGAGAIAYYKPINGVFSRADVFEGFLAGSMTDGSMKARTRWTNNGYRLKASGEFDVNSAVGIAGAETDGPGLDSSDSDSFGGGIDQHVDMAARKKVGGPGMGFVSVGVI